MKVPILHCRLHPVESKLFIEPADTMTVGMRFHVMMTYLHCNPAAHWLQRIGSTLKTMLVGGKLAV